MQRLAPIAVWLLVAATASPARGDLLHLQGGYTLQVEVLEDKGDKLRVRTTLGTYDIEKKQIISRETAPAPWKLYEQEKAKHTDTADDQFRLAEWCGEHGLRSEQRKHLLRVVELSPDHFAARRLLGHVKREGKWVEEKTVHAVDDCRQETERQARAEEKEVQKLVAKWFVRVKAIANGKLEGKGNPPTGANFKNGRRQILAINDPFALPALASVLSRGKVETRLLLIEALSGFNEDEASMDLVVIALVDAERAVRREAAQALRQRKDPRVVSALRHGLNSDREFTVRSAATALGILGAKDAVEDLIGALTTERIEFFPGTQYVFLDSLFYDFAGPSRYAYADRFLYYRAERIWCYDSLDYFRWINQYQAELVTVSRTEVQEALIAITGQNFGFDAAKWREWVSKR